jgi:mannose-6-phosphate isomerase-like protein (cupin superfamily)
MSINPDAHSTREIDLTHWGIEMARKGGCPRSASGTVSPCRSSCSTCASAGHGTPMRPDLSTTTHGDNKMPMLENVKKIAERVTGWSRPKRSTLRDLIRERKTNTFSFKDDGIIPNHPQWPLVIYRGAVRLPENLDPAAVFEELFEGNRWGDSWRDGIYDYVHYHSRIHEVLGIARGEGKVQFGGKRGRIVRLKAGDVAVLPAGTGHQRLSAN